MEIRRDHESVTRATLLSAGGVLSVGFFLVAGISAWAFTEAAGAAGCDATTGASASIIGVATTTGSATISWTERRHNGERWFCYGESAPSKCGKVQSRASGAKNEVVTGLKANTKYLYKLYGVWKGNQKSIVTGCFTTDGSSCGTATITLVEVDGVALTAGGDSLENVTVTLVRKSDNKLMETDTTDRSGGFLFEADPGTYQVGFAYAPFTAPAPYTVVVIARKPQTLPDQIFKDAFQVGGTVVAANGIDTLTGVTVTVAKKSDYSAAGTRITDDEGHFNIGLKAGDYLVNASIQGKSLPTPVSVTVTKDMEIPKLVLPIGSASLHRYPGRECVTGSIPGLDGYRVNGVRSQTSSAGAFEVFRTR